MRLMRRDLGIKIPGISGKEVVVTPPAWGQAGTFQRGWIHGTRAEGTLGMGRSIAGAALSVSLAPPSLPTLPFPVFAVNREYL